MKKKHYLVTLFVTLLVLFAISCGDDNENANDTQPPMIEFLGEELEGLPGETVNIKAKVTDDAGIKVGSINSIFYFLHKAAEPFNCLEQDNLA